MQEVLIFVIGVVGGVVLVWVVMRFRKSEGKIELGNGSKIVPSDS